MPTYSQIKADPALLQSLPVEAWKAFKILEAAEKAGFHALDAAGKDAHFAASITMLEG